MQGGDIVSEVLDGRGGKSSTSLPYRLRPLTTSNVDPPRFRGSRAGIFLLAIETTCDETAAAVLEGPRPPRIGVPRIRSSVVASQVGLHQRYGGVVPEIASREHVRQILPMIDEALRRAGVSLARPGRRRRGDAAGPRRCPGRRPDGGQGAGPGARDPADRRRPPRGSSLRLPARLSRPRGLPVHRPGRLGRAHQPLSSAAARSSTSRWAARPTTRRARRSTRWPACSAWDIPAVPRSSAWPRGRNPAAFAFPRSFLHDDRLDLQFLGPEDGRPLRPPRSECAVREIPTDDEADQRRGRELPGGRRRRHRGQDAPGAGADRV